MGKVRWGGGSKDEHTSPSQVQLELCRWEEEEAGAGGFNLNFTDIC